MLVSYTRAGADFSWYRFQTFPVTWIAPRSYLQQAPAPRWQDENYDADAHSASEFGLGPSQHLSDCSVAASTSTRSSISLALLQYRHLPSIRRIITSSNLWKKMGFNGSFGWYLF